MTSETFALDHKGLPERLAPFPRYACGASSSSTHRGIGRKPDLSSSLHPPAPEAMTVPLPSWASEKESGGLSSSCSESSNGSLSPMQPTRCPSPGRLGSGEAPALSSGLGSVRRQGTQALRRVPRLAALMPPSMALASAVGSGRASRSLSPHGQREKTSFVTAYTAPTSARLSSPRPGQNALCSSLASLTGSFGTSGQLCHGSWCRGSFESRASSPRGTTSLSVGSRGHGQLGSSFRLASKTTSLSSPMRYVGRRSSSAVGNSSRPGSPVQATVQVLNSLMSRAQDAGFEDADKENQCLSRREKIKENAQTRNKVLGSIDNTLRSSQNSSFQSQAIPPSKTKAWTWDSKWAYDSDFEEDEMHHQLWLRQPSAAGQFKRLSSGRYLFKREKVELKIVYAQIFATMEDGQVISLEDLLCRHMGCSSSEDTAGASISLSELSSRSQTALSQST